MGIAAQPKQAMSAYQGAAPEQNNEDKVASSLQELLSRQAQINEQSPELTAPAEMAPQAPVQTAPAPAENMSMSQKAESEFEQWLNKARSTMVEQEAEIQPHSQSS